MRSSEGKVSKTLKYSRVKSSLFSSGDVIKGQVMSSKVKLVWFRSSDVIKGQAGSSLFILGQVMS